jgi:hypothetical protein
VAGGGGARCRRPDKRLIVQRMVVPVNGLKNISLICQTATKSVKSE